MKLPDFNFNFHLSGRDATLLVSALIVLALFGIGAGATAICLLSLGGIILSAYNLFEGNGDEWWIVGGVCLLILLALGLFVVPSEWSSLAQKLKLQ
jgi:hypothetical protein